MRIPDDHVPHLIDDTAWDHRSRAHAIGSITGLMQAITTAQSWVWRRME